MSTEPKSDLYVNITDVEQVPEQNQTRFKMTLGGRIILATHENEGSN